MNKLRLQLWIRHEIIHLCLKVNEGTLSPDIANPQIKLLEKLMDEFNLVEVTEKEEMTT